MSRPPAATNGIMYETPVMIACWMRLPQPSLAPSSPCAAVAVPETRRAFGFFAAARASSSILVGSLMARFTPDSMTGRPANRSRSFTPTSVAKMTAAALRMVPAGSKITEPEPWVSTWTSTPISLPALTRWSAAMKVCAMPVGHAVMATTTGRSAPAAAPATGAAVAAVAAGTAAGTAAGAGSRTSSTRATISSLEDAARSEARNSFFTSARASLVRSLRWSASPPSAAAMRNTRSAGPSLAPKSTGLDSRAKASELWLTSAERQWGMANPPGRPVAALPSRSMASRVRPAASALPASATRRASDSMTSALVAPRSASSATSSVVINFMSSSSCVGDFRVGVGVSGIVGFGAV